MRQLCWLVARIYQGNMLIYRLLKLTFSCLYDIWRGLRSSMYQYIFSFLKQASPNQFIWNPESETLFLSFFPLYKTTDTGFQTRKISSSKKDGNDRIQTIPMSNKLFFSPTRKTNRKIPCQKCEVWPIWDFPPGISVFIWSMVGYSIISKSKLSSLIVI